MFSTAAGVLMRLSEGFWSSVLQRSSKTKVIRVFSELWLHRQSSDLILWILTKFSEFMRYHSSMQDPGQDSPPSIIKRYFTSKKSLSEAELEGEFSRRLVRTSDPQEEKRPAGDQSPAADSST